MIGYSYDELVECEGCGQMHYEDELEDGLCKTCLEEDDEDVEEE